MARAYDIRERRVHIRGLTLNAQVGVYEEEKHYPQRLLLDLELVVQLTDNSPDNISQVVDYGALASSIRALALQQHTELLETLAEQIAQLCLRDPRVTRVDLRLEKPDIFSDADGVGISLSIVRNQNSVTNP